MLSLHNLNVHSLDLIRAQLTAGNGRLNDQQWESTGLASARVHLSLPVGAAAGNTYFYSLIHLFFSRTAMLASYSPTVAFDSD